MIGYRASALGAEQNKHTQQQPPQNSTCVLLLCALSSSCTALTMLVIMPDSVPSTKESFSPAASSPARATASLVWSLMNPRMFDVDPTTPRPWLTVGQAEEGCV